MPDQPSTDPRDLSQTELDHECGHTNGGVWTHFDPYGMRRRKGLPVRTIGGGICWPCWTKWGAKVDKRARRETDKIARLDNVCGVLDVWIGYCTRLKPCTTHGRLRCWHCKAPATRTCGSTSSLVCGTPECDDHPHRHGD